MTSAQTTTEPQYHHDEGVRKLSGRAATTGLGVILVLVALDQFVKYLIVEWLGPDAGQHRWELAGRYLAFQYVENEGAAFGILAGRTALLTVLAICVAIWFVAMARRDLVASAGPRMAIALILAGAIGNLVDRVRLGYVVDFVAVGIWPKFNFADICITVALVILGWTMLLAPAPSTEPRPATTVGRETKDANGERHPASE